MDDSRVFLKALSGFLSAQPEVEIAGEASSGLEALGRVSELNPDLVLMDLAMPRMSGLEATRKLKAGPKPPFIIILSMHTEAEFREAAQIAGADGFCSKYDITNQLMPGILAFCGGQKGEDSQ